jgi:hypothetical protein
MQASEEVLVVGLLDAPVMRSQRLKNDFTLRDAAR